MKYIKQLDSLRAIAVILVIIQHWFPERNQLSVYTSIFNGVDIFFVLSGFLITNILLVNRNETEQSGLAKSTVVKNFFIRRVLRIFPVYYLLIFSLLLFAHTTDTTIKENFIYYVTYTVNIYFFNIQGWDGMLSHLWSLSVEEQFYLFWPWLMLFVRKSWLLPVIILSFTLGVLAQLLLPHGGLLTFSCLDGFGAGAFLAWILIYNPQLLVRTKSLWPALAVVGVGFHVFRVMGVFQPVPSRTLTAFVTIWVIMEIVQSKDKKSFLFHSFLNNRILIFMGKISYGMYLYHLLLPKYTFGFFKNINTLLPAALSNYNFYLVRLESFGLLLFISYLSWRLIERPVLGLKKYFDYQKHAVQPSENIVLPTTISSIGVKEKL